MACVKCGAELEAPAKGRRPRYCGEACRRAAELEVRRIQHRLEDLEARAECYRPGRATYEWGYGPERAAEIHAEALEDVSRHEARLRELLDPGEDDDEELVIG